MTVVSLQATEPVVDVPSDVLSPWGSPRQRAAQRRNKHDALLATAARLFKQQGFASTALDQMAVQLGITKPTLYYYVRSKSELVHACAMQGWGVAIAAVQRALDSAGADRVALALKAYASVVSSDFGWCMVRVGEYAQPAQMCKAIAQQRKTVEQLLASASHCALPAPVILRALEGVVLALPKTQWAGAIAVLAAPQAAANTVLGASQAAVPVRQPDVVPAVVASAVLTQDMQEPAARRVTETLAEPEPEPEPERVTVSIENQPLTSDLPTQQKPIDQSSKRRKKTSKVVEQISLF